MSSGVKFRIVLGAGVIVATLALGGCQQPSSSQPGQGRLATAASDSKSGSQLWAENCSRCHYGRPPQSFSPTQWDAIVAHMRLRADLTGQEARQIAEFLKASD